MGWNDDNNQQQGAETNHDDKNNFSADQFWNDCKQKFREISGKFGKQFDMGRLFNYLITGLVIAWLASGIYIVDQGNRGVVTRFGAYVDTTKPGPHWHLPYPIEEVAVINVENQRFIEVGYRSGVNRRLNSGAVLPEALMLTKDENIINVSLAVQYQIKNARDYVFNVRANEETLKQVTESIQRGVIGRNTMDYILTEGRSQVVFEIKDEMQKAIDSYGAGIVITSVNLQDAQPPEEVQNAFEDAIRAREDKQRLINEAQAYANEVIPKARGAAARLLKEAEGFEAKVVEKAKGEADRFDQLLVEYENAPEITRKRLYLEAKEKLYKQNNKVLVNADNANNMFYMPLNQFQQNSNQLSTADNKFLKNKPKKVKIQANKPTIRSSRSRK